MADLVKVLAIDGGGIRGVIPAMLLAEIERLTQRPISELFDLIAGTSTGGILALGVTKPTDDRIPAYSASELIGIYEEDGSEIFSAGPWHRLTALGNLLEERYPARGVETVLQRYFGDAPLESALKDLLITAYDIERRTPFFFKSYRADRNYPMWQVARATSAAPTYFEPALLENPRSTDRFTLVDGGVFANNPAMCAHVEAKNRYPDFDDILVVSLGTGETHRPISYEDAKGWGLALWAQPMLGLVFDGVSDTVDHQLQTLCNRDIGVTRYYRFQTELTRASDDMDDASRANIRNLKYTAEFLIESRQEDLEELSGLLGSQEIADGP